MKHRILLPLLLLLVFPMCSCGNGSGDDMINTDDSGVSIVLTPESLDFTYEKGSQTITVVSSAEWGVSSDQTWCTLSRTGGTKGSSEIVITVVENTGNGRTATVKFHSGSVSETVIVTQAIDPENVVEPLVPDSTVVVPEGYQLVWQDEFNDNGLPDTSRWWYETGASGWGNNELENYVSGTIGTDSCAIVKNGMLKIVAKKIGSTVYSIRMNTSQSWTYGYFEARLKLPGGKGTWPAFWMMPKNYTAWPDDGEIDIMEEVGYRANYVSSSIHCSAYNHMLGTQKTAEKYLSTAESAFHVYALEWTADYIKTYVDGVNVLTFDNDGANNKATWPFNAAFYLKLNLAWGGDWGGAEGVDESVLPATYVIDYVRVFQKK
ncbi:MAG: family 16 glycosylhydrolase [Bacteroidaceae bacterium]|nr:family 16 glycosylhydrolase [Bacteroidaceae bacterium]